MSAIYAFTKKIKEGNIDHRKITDQIDISKIIEVINRLENLPKTGVLNLDDLRLRSNAKNWINSLLTKNLNKEKTKDMDYLLSDFTDSMQTRMREESKYAIGLLFPNNLILCHSSFGEETITPEWKTIPRMLDTDNVLRFVSFSNEKGIIKSTYWEREATSSFIEWLGLPHKSAFLFGGKYRIECEIEGITTELQLNEGDIDKWPESHPEFSKGNINFSRPFQSLSIAGIKAGRRTYDNPKDFIQVYEAEKLGIPYYTREYERINSNPLPMLIKYYDEKTQLVKKEGEEEIIEVSKAETSFDILFVNENINFRASYISNISTRFLNGEPINVFHAGVRFNASPYNIGSMNIYNAIYLDDLTKQIIDYYHSTNLQDTNLAKLIQYAIFKRISKTNSNLPILHFLTNFQMKLWIKYHLNINCLNLKIVC